jgi:hypothetical protein
MFTRHPSDRLAAYCDGQLHAAEARVVESHLATCERCRRECDEARFAAAALRQLAMASPPPSVWNALDRRLCEPTRPARAGWHWYLPFAVAGVVIVVAAAALYPVWNRPGSGPWQVAIEQAGQSAETRRHDPGEWVETGQDSRARIAIGSIGTVEVQPNARVKLGTAASSQYRLSLERGTISAAIIAPPRMFIVDTPASTVVDLGCAYTVTVALDGTMELRMTSGWAALEWEGTETLIPAGATSRTRKGHRPGLPYFEDAPLTLQQAVAAIDLHGATDDELARVLMAARERDTLTLWHLLSRTEAAQRRRVVERLEALVPLPTGVTPERVQQLDPEALRKWREDLAWHW